MVENAIEQCLQWQSNMAMALQRDQCFTFNFQKRQYIFSIRVCCRQLQLIHIEVSHLCFSNQVIIICFKNLSQQNATYLAGIRVNFFATFPTSPAMLDSVFPLFKTNSSKFDQLLRN